MSSIRPRRECLLLLLFLSPSRRVEGQFPDVNPPKDVRHLDAKPTTDRAAGPLNPRILRGETTLIRAVTFSADGSKLATIDEGGPRLWDSANGAELHRLPHGEFESFASPTFSPDGRWVAAGGSAGLPPNAGLGFNMHVLDVENSGFVLIWDVQTGRKHAVIKGKSVHAAALTLDSDCKSATSLSGKYVLNLWDVPRGRKLLELDTLRAETTYESPRYCRFGFSAEGDRAIALNLAPVDRARPIKLWDTTTRRAWTFASPVEAPRAIAISPDGGRFAIGGGEGVIALRDADSGAELRRLRPEEGRKEGPKNLAYLPEGILILAFSPDGKELVSAGRDAVVRVWDAETGRLIREVEGPRGRVRAVAFPAEGVRVASGGIEVVREPSDMEPLTIWDIPLDRADARKP